MTDLHTTLNINVHKDHAPPLIEALSQSFNGPILLTGPNEDSLAYLLATLLSCQTMSNLKPHHNPQPSHNSKIHEGPRWPILELSKHKFLISLREAITLGWPTLIKLKTWDILGSLQHLINLFKITPNKDIKKNLSAKWLPTTIFHQRLISSLCPQCRVHIEEQTLFDLQRQRDQSTTFLARPAILSGSFLERLTEALQDHSQIHLKGPGCEHCNQTGLIGHHPILETIRPDQIITEALLQNRRDKATAHWLTNLKGSPKLQQTLTLISSGQADPLLAEIQTGLPLNLKRPPHPS